MYEYLVNPTVLLCLAITLVCVSLLYFVLKRSISMLENAQMEQAKVLQSFIERVDMNHVNIMSSPVNNNHYEETVQNEPLTNEVVKSENNLIDVSDDESDSDSDSDSESSDDESENEYENDETEQNNEPQTETENQEEININQLESVEDGIKIVQMDNFEIESLEDVDVSDLKDTDDTMKVFNLQQTEGPMEQRLKNMLDDNESSEDESSEDESSEDESNHAGEDNVENNNVTDKIMVNKENDTVKENDNFSEKSDITVNYKTLSVKILRTMAIENGLMTEGEKKNKKEIIELLENK